MASKARARQRNLSRSGSKNSSGWRNRSSRSPLSGSRSGKEKAYCMGRRMSGTPSCAFTLPSWNCTALCTTDCGCTSTWMRSTGTPKSHLASITSKPLFIIVALSMVILAPMSQVGWRSASWHVTVASCSLGSRRKGPPLAVSSIFSISLSSSPTRLWKMALCSLSTGRMGAWCSAASRQMSSPATTRVSLLARQIFLPARMAWMVGERPAKPTMAVSTMSTGPASTISSSALAPA